MPDTELDSLLGLEETIQRKIRQAAASVGVGAVMPGQAATDRDFTLTRTQIEDLRTSDPSLFIGATKSANSGQEYRQELKTALADPILNQAMMRLPWGSGTGFEKALAGSGPSFVFAARVGDDPDIQYRYVDLSDNEPVLISDVLTCLDYAHPASPDSQRQLSDELYAFALGVWKTASEDIVEKWMELADRTKLRPAAPKALQAAASALRASTHPRQNELVEILDQNINDQRRLRPIRTALASSDDPNEQALALETAIDRLGLRASPAPEPRPKISIDDVHLVCWTAITHSN